LIFLHFWIPYDVYFQVQALNSNHALSKARDQGILSNLLILVQHCTVKCFGGNHLLNHDLNLISL